MLPFISAEDFSIKREIRVTDDGMDDLSDSERELSKIDFASELYSISRRLKWKKNCFLKIFLLI